MQLKVLERKAEILYVNEKQVWQGCIENKLKGKKYQRWNSINDITVVKSIEIFRFITGFSCWKYLYSTAYIK